MRGLTRQIAVALSAAFMIVVSLFGEGNGNPIYDTFPTAISPAQYTFWVWAPIFIGSAALAVYQALPARRDDRRLDALGWPLVVAFISNGLTAYTAIGVSNIVIIVVLVALFFAFRVLMSLEAQDHAFFWFVHVPLVIFFAWITVATLVNTSQWLVSVGWSGLGIPVAVWSAILIGVATLLGLFVVLRHQEPAYGLVLIWAFWGIVVAHPAAAITWTTAGATGVMLVAIGWHLRIVPWLRHTDPSHT